MGFLKNLLTAFFMKPFKPNLLESEEYNHELFLKHRGTEELWRAMKSQWVFADNSKSEFYDHYKYDEMNKRTYSLESKHIKLREQIESDWSVMYNTKCFVGPLADTFEQLCIEDIKVYLKSISIKREYVPNLEIHHFKTLTRLAMLYDKQGKYSQAIEVCEKAIELGIDERPRLTRLLKKQEKIQ